MGRSHCVAWAAGFFEGEGSSGVHKSKSGPYESHYPKLTVVQVDREPLEKMKRIFGGSVTRRRRATGNWQEQFAWIAVGAGALHAMQEMWPHLSPRRRAQFSAAVDLSTETWADKVGYHEWKESVLGEDHSLAAV